MSRGKAYQGKTWSHVGTTLADSFWSREATAPLQAPHFVSKAEYESEFHFRILFLGFFLPWFLPNCCNWGLELYRLLKWGLCSLPQLFLNPNRQKKCLPYCRQRPNQSSSISYHFSWTRHSSIWAIHHFPVKKYDWLPFHSPYTWLQTAPVHTEDQELQISIEPHHLQKQTWDPKLPNLNILFSMTALWDPVQAHPSEDDEKRKPWSANHFDFVVKM